MKDYHHHPFCSRFHSNKKPCGFCLGMPIRNNHLTSLILITNHMFKITYNVSFSTRQLLKKADIRMITITDQLWQWRKGIIKNYSRQWYFFFSQMSLRDWIFKVGTPPWFWKVKWIICHGFFHIYDWKKQLVIVKQMLSEWQQTKQIQCSGFSSLKLSFEQKHLL